MDHIRVRCQAVNPVHADSQHLGYNLHLHPQRIGAHIMRAGVIDAGSVLIHLKHGG